MKKLMMMTSLFLMMSSLPVAMASHAHAFEIGSNDLVDGGNVPLANAFNGMGCKGKDISPEIHWSNPPAGTKSFAVTVYDSKAPTGSGFWHWILIDVPANVSSIAQGTSGANVGKVIANDFGLVSFDGPCPPAGMIDPYTFTVYALNTDKLENLGLQNGATNAVVRFFLQAGGSILGQASFTVNTGRQ
jgi:Raf kinase inhibitor-like YbhB/YbcL family protein